MKTFVLLFLLICNSLYSQTSSTKISSDQTEYYRSHLNELTVVFGNGILNNTLETDSLIFTGEAISNQLGTSVSSAGDVNGDGKSDIIVGARGYNSNMGRAYIYYGGPNMDNIADVTITGETNNEFGCSVSTAGDVNADGYSDVIVGAYNYNGIGGAFIFYGGAVMDNVVDVTMTGEATGNGFGYSVSSAGDLNADGCSDVIVGATAYNSGKGRTYVFYGGSSMNNIADVIMTGETVNNYFGESVSSAGDINGDGFSDVIVGANGFSSNIGRAYIYYGGSTMNNIADVIMTGYFAGNNFGISVSSAGDVNGDGYSDVIVGAYGIGFGRAEIFYGSPSMNNIPDIILFGETENSRFGYSVSAAGDVNGDGYSDVIVGAWLYNSSIGRASIFYGGPSMNNIVDVTLTGETGGDRFGISVSAAGDVNGDGYLDVLVGAEGFNSDRGRAYLYINLGPKPRLIFPSNSSINNSLSINFRWNKLITMIQYILKVSTDSAFNNIIVNDTILIDTSKTVSGFLMERKYFWRVIAKDTSGTTNYSSVWSFKTIPTLKINLKALMEGLYFPVFNQLTRKDTVIIYLRNASSPYALVDSAKSPIDSLTLTGLFQFNNAPSGTYYIIVKHLNSIETWSKSGGENLVQDGTICNFDFTTSSSKAYGNNLKLKGSKYCFYSGDVNQDGFVSLFDVIIIYNDASNFLSGRFLITDLNGDNIVDLTDVTLCYNNASNFVGVIRP